MNRKVKNILQTVLWIFAVTGLIVSLGFVNNKEKEIKGKTVEVFIADNGENNFVDEDDLIDFFKNRDQPFVDQELKDIDVSQIEKMLNAHPAVSSANVSVTINGNVEINVKQRNPIARVYTASGDSYYIDIEGKLMPLSDKFTANVLLVNGFVIEPFHLFRQYNLGDMKKDSLLAAVNLLDDIYEVSLYINNDTLLKPLIQQAYVNREREIILYPAVGNQKIIFGDGKNIEEKFKKLKIFYLEGMNSISGWKKYESINLKYKDQVICTKK